MFKLITQKIKTYICSKQHNKLIVGKKYLNLSFDASLVENNNTNIGLYNISDNKKLFYTRKITKTKKYSPFFAELEGFKVALNYAKELNAEYVNIYSDNLHLVETIDTGLFKYYDLKKLISSYKFKDFNITWVPRQLNVVADRLSKSKPECNDNTIRDLTNDINFIENLGFSDNPSNISSTDKLRLLKIFARTRSEKEVARMCKSGVRGHYVFSTSKDKLFLRFTRTLLNENDMKTYVINRFKKLESEIKPFNKVELQKEFNNRLNELKIKNA